MQDILFVCEHLPHEGGIGSALVNLLFVLDRTKYRIHLCVLCKYIDPAVKIPDDVHRIDGVRLMEDHIINYAKRKKEFSHSRRFEMLAMKMTRRVIGFPTYEKIALRHYRVNGQYDVAIAYSNDICINGKPVSGGSHYCVLNCVKAKRKIAWIHNEVARQGFTKEYCSEAFRDYDYVVNVSLACKKMFDEMIPEYAYKSRCVYNIIDEDRVNSLLSEDGPRIMTEKKARLRFLTVARIEEGQKKISRILQCTKSLLEKNIKDFIWVVLGDGPDLTRFVGETKRLGLDEYIVFLGNVENPYIYMRNADVMILPSLYESFGIVLKEAICVGCPVIATNFEASSEIVKDGWNGVICENSTQGILNAIRKVISSPNLLDDLRRNIDHDKGSINDLAEQQFDLLVQ